MGDLSKRILNGDCCQGCGVSFTTRGGGFPRSCRVCWPNDGLACVSIQDEMRAMFPQAYAALDDLRKEITRGK